MTLRSSLQQRGGKKRERGFQREAGPVGRRKSAVLKTWSKWAPPKTPSSVLFLQPMRQFQVSHISIRVKGQESSVLFRRETLFLLRSNLEVIENLIFFIP